MKHLLLILYLILFSFTANSLAQNVTNTGATITVSNGAKLTLTNTGNYTNEGGVLSILGTTGEIVIPGNFVNNSGTVDLNGIMTLSGNFTNNAANNVFQTVGTDGTLIFAGSGIQTISTSEVDMSNYINFENVTIGSSSLTHLNAGSAATVNGILNVLAGGEFRLLSPTDGEEPSGSLITNTDAASNVTGAGALYVDRHFETAGRYQYISIPVNNGSDDDFDNTKLLNNFNPNLFVYDEAYDALPDNPENTNYSNWTDPTYAFYDAWTVVADEGSNIKLDGSLAKGYVTYNEIELDVNFGGSPSNLNNASSYPPVVSYTANDGNAGYYDGWNIVGNPYPVAIDFYGITRNNIDGTVYYWDGEAGNYKYYNYLPEGTQIDVGSNVVNGGTRYIPAMQAFSVKANGLSPSLVINSTNRIHNNHVLFKGNPKDSEVQYIKLSTDYNGFSDETVVRFVDGTLPEFDNEYDAYKMFPNNTDIPMIYSLVLDPETPVAINTLPISTVGTAIPLGFKTKLPGSFSIMVKEFNFSLDTEVKLIDTYLNTETILDQAVEYSFNFSGDEVRDRFYLFVGSKAGTDIEDNELNSKVNIWSSFDKVYITISSNDLIDANVQIVDVLGKNIVQKNIFGTYNIINVPSSSGTYFVKLKTKDGKSYLNKVFIQK